MLHDQRKGTKVSLELLRQWHPTRNGALNSSRISPWSHMKVWWLCSEGHEWQATIASRSNGNGCPYCSGRKASPGYNLAVNKPGLAEEWHDSRNGSLKPFDVPPGSHKKVWWKCSKGHERRATIDTTDS